MEAKEIIEKMTKGLVIVPDKLSNVRVSSLKVSVSYGAGIGHNVEYKKSVGIKSTYLSATNK